MNGTRIFSGGYDKKVTEWTAPLSTLPADASKEKIFYSILKPASKWEPASEPMVPVFDSNVQQPAPAQMALKSPLSSLEYDSEPSTDSDVLPSMPTQRCTFSDVEVHQPSPVLNARGLSPPKALNGSARAFTPQIRPTVQIFGIPSPDSSSTAARLSSQSTLCFQLLMGSTPQLHRSPSRTRLDSSRPSSRLSSTCLLQFLSDIQSRKASKTRVIVDQMRSTPVASKEGRPRNHSKSSSENLSGPSISHSDARDKKGPGSTQGGDHDESDPDQPSGTENPITPGRNSDNYYSYINSTEPDPFGILRFFMDELQASENASEKIWIIGHVLSGWDGTAAQVNPTNLFYQIVDRFSPHVIANIFYDHTILLSSVTLDPSLRHMTPPRHITFESSSSSESDSDSDFSSASLCKTSPVEKTAPNTEPLKGRKRKRESSGNDNDNKTKSSKRLRSQKKDNEESSYPEHTQDPNEIHQQVVITAIHATDLTLGLRRILAGFHVVIKTDGAECQTSNKPVHVDQAVVKWTEPILLYIVPNLIFPARIEKDSRSCDPSSKVQVSVYASFELGPMLGHGEVLRTFEISVRELLDCSESHIPYSFSPSRGKSYPHLFAPLLLYPRYPMSIAYDYNQVEKGFEFLKALVDDMVNDDPRKRPTMEVVVERFESIRQQLRTWKLRSRVISQDEGPFENLYHGVTH
ncbi:hypothetical protein BD769DRAFT_1683513 [Suillus cothurnatus]|nr:hypothetical protein BD769DRAFT_1683513 [Suillus cothurnatus]